MTGRPIPARSRAVPQPEARRVFGLPEAGPVLLVFGGSLGATLLNDLALEAFGAAGPGGAAPLRRRATTTGSRRA